MAIRAIPAQRVLPGSTSEPDSRRLLVTKLARPRVREDLVARPRLFALLDQGVEHKLTLISTGPGYGKSTLAADWLATSSLPGAWLSLDAGDDEPHTFVRYLVAALQTIDPELCTELAHTLNGDRTPSMRALVTALINELAIVTRPFVLVLDDLHLITSPEVIEGLALLVQNLPHMMRLVVATRSDPALPLLRMRARGELVEVRATDIAFTHDEARALLSGRYGLTVDERELQDIQQWAEGWPVGLMLIGQRLQGTDQIDRRALLERLGDDARFVQDYLWQETIAHQPPERRRFLLETSILDRFDASLCAEVTNLPTAAAMLHKFESDNLFLIGAEGTGRWFRYHHLFADVLRKQLARDYDPQDILELHQRAARWHLTHGTSEEAARHTVAGQDWERALPLLRQICAELYTQDRVETLGRWLDPIPQTALQRDPELSCWLAWAWVRKGKVAEALTLLEAADPGPGSEHHTLVRVTMLHVQVLQAVFTQWGPPGLDLSRQLESLLEPHQETDWIRLHIYRALLFGVTGDVESADASLREARTVIQESGGHLMRLVESANYATVLIMRGRLREAADILRAVIAAGDEWNDVVVQNAYSKLALIHFEWNELDTVDELVTRAYDISVKTSTPLHRTRLHRLRAEVAWARGDSARASKEIDLALDYARSVGIDADIGNLEARRALFWIESGYLDRAREWADQRALDPTQEPPYPRLPEYLTLLRLMALDGQKRRVVTLLDRVQRNAERSGRMQDLVTVLVQRAVLEYELDDLPAATRSLTWAARIGAAEGFTRSILMYGEQLAPVMRRALGARDGHAKYWQSLLREMGGAESLPQSGAANPLSNRETEVLTLIAAGESNRQIADRLFISEQTVKKHVSNIFDKLSVVSRTQAIDRGRRLGIL